MRPEKEYQKALELIKSGVNDCEVGRRLGIPRGTIRDWRVGLEKKSGGRTESWSSRRTGRCFRCDGGWVDQEAYSYLLGMYLGDGCLSPGPRDVYRLRVFCDLAYVDIINETATHIVIARGVDEVTFTPKNGCVEVSAYWKHWPCLFPQHGPGRKHERNIELAEWQQLIVQPKGLVRGLIHSDGTRHINEVTRTLSTGPKSYRYPRYQLSNKSNDILSIFSDALDQLGVHWTRTSQRDISVARREDVSFLDTFVGPKR